MFTEESEILWPDSNRLDSGQFELVSKPYALHQSKLHSLISSWIIPDCSLSSSPPVTFYSIAAGNGSKRVDITDRVGY